MEASPSQRYLKIRFRCTHQAVCIDIPVLLIINRSEKHDAHAFIVSMEVGGMILKMNRIMTDREVR